MSRTETVRLSPEDWDEQHRRAAACPVNPGELEVFRELTGFRAGDRVADLGCGTGEWTHVLADAGAEVTGFDFSPYALVMAHRDRSGRYAEWDIEAAPLPRDLRPGSMDIVTFRDSLQWLPVYRLLHDVHRVLRPGGALHIQDNPRTNHPSAQGPDETRDVRFGQRLAATDVTAVRTLQGWRTPRLVRTGDAVTLVLHRD
ncbi:class I SAM-dependent methyltransferase [Streptomyces uncialis]|uniref:class I SAM-dependent methyltransferase n=1 Tax=Streptomyces uncialis TaxID=1048205 RepID=UPI00386CF7FC|nr:class I SAM-dependent methyltransferase [Streptomyces uncialis]